MATPPDERQIAHQVPDPTMALVLMVPASRALLCTAHILDRAVCSLLGENTRNSRGSPFITLPQRSLCSLPGRVVVPAFPTGHFSLAGLASPGNPLRGRLEAPGSYKSCLLVRNNNITINYLSINQQQHF